ncbi:MAG: ABC transporter substrate-binding protein [Clostridiaceae bacterium]|nr:ABC transporter substrate-binding protein [Clostridiaceae bacterium]
MKAFRKITCIFIMMIMTVFLALGCESHVNDKNIQAENNDSYKVDSIKLEGGMDWGIPNPFLNEPRGPGSGKMKLVYASLLEKDENKDIPWLAEKWEIDGNNYKFVLFKGETFQDGTPLTSKDVAFTIDYYKKHPPVTNNLGVGEKFLIDSYEIIDDETIIIKVNKPNADTLSNLGSFVILPKHIWEKVDDPNNYTGDGYLVGSGAFKCTNYDGATGSYEFTAYEGWLNGKQATRKIQFVPVSDALLAFENDEIDITTMPADLSDKYLKDDSIGTIEKTNDFGYKMLINYEKCNDFLNMELRRAVYHALNRKAIVDKVFRGMGEVGSAGYVPVGSKFYNEDVEKYDYDLEAAKTAFSGKDLSIKLLTEDSGECLKVGELIKNDLEKAGVKVTIEAYDCTTRDEKVNKGDYEFALVGNGGWGNNPPTYMRTLFSDESKFKGTSPAYMGAIGYSNEEITKLAEEQNYEVDFEKRKKMFKDLQYLVSKEIPIIVIANESSYSMYKKDYYDGWMKSYAYQQTEQNRLSYMAR